MCDVAHSRVRFSGFNFQCVIGIKLGSFSTKRASMILHSVTAISSLRILIISEKVPTFDNFPQFS